MIRRDFLSMLGLTPALFVSNDLLNQEITEEEVVSVQNSVKFIVQPVEDKNGVEFMVPNEFSVLEVKRYSFVLDIDPSVFG